MVGNPINSPIVEDTYRACKNKDGKRDRRHSRAMRFEDMEKIHAYREAHCPSEAEAKTDEEKKRLRGEYLRYAALSTLSWTIWTR